jgi:hypothetical protein
LTSDAPDYFVQVAIPIRFNLPFSHLFLGDPWWVVTIADRAARHFRRHCCINFERLQHVVPRAPRALVLKPSSCGLDS